MLAAFEEGADVSHCWCEKFEHDLLFAPTTPHNPLGPPALTNSSSPVPLIFVLQCSHVLSGGSMLFQMRYSYIDTYMEHLPSHMIVTLRAHGSNTEAPFYYLQQYY